MAERVQVVIEAQDNASGVIRGLLSQLGKLGEVLSDGWDVISKNNAAWKLYTKGLTDTTVSIQDVAKAEEEANIAGTRFAQMLATLVVQALVDAYNAAQEYAGQVRDLSLASGATAEEASRLLQVLDDFQISADDVTSATRKMTQVGIEPTIESIAKLSDQYLALNAGQERNQFIQDNLGRAGSKWNFLLSQGSEKILAMNEAVSENLILNAQNLSDLDRLRLAQDAYNDSILGYQVALVTQAAPAIVNYLDYNTQLLNLKDQNLGFWAEQGQGISMTAALYKDLFTGTTSFTDALSDERNAMTAQAEAAKISSDALSGLLSLTQKLNDASREQIKLSGYQELKDQLTASGGVLTEDEAAILNRAGVDLGIFNEGAVKSAASITKMAAAVDAGTASLDAYISMLNSIPTSITTTISAVTVSGTQGSLLAGADAYNNNNPTTPQADGGPVNPGQTYLVGERGPELFTPKSGGEIVPNDKLSGGATFYGATVYIENSNMSFMEDR